MISGIYTITNLLDNKIYVGSSSNITKRLTEHLRNLRKNKHSNIHLQRAWNRHKEQNFVFENLEFCNGEYLLSMENYWCNLLNTHDRKYGYNIRSINPEKWKEKLSQEIRDRISSTRKRLFKEGILVCPMKGKTLSQEIKDKISKGRSGKNCGKDNYMYGRTHTKEARKKIGDTHRGKLISQEHRDRLSKFQTGRVSSAETREKISRSNLGQKVTEVTRRKISNTLSGRIKEFPKEVLLRIKDFLEGKISLELKKLLQFTLNGEFVKDWECVTEVEEQLNIKTTNISKVCLGRYGFRSASGFLWKYKNENIKK